MGLTLHHIMSLVINSLGGTHARVHTHSRTHAHAHAHTHTHTYTHTNFIDKMV